MNKKKKKITMPLYDLPAVQPKVKSKIKSKSSFSKKNEIEIIF